MTFWIFAVTLTLKALLQFYSKDTLAYDDVSSDQFWLPKNQQFKNYSWKNHILIMRALAVTLTLKIANKSFCITLGLMMLRHCTKLGTKKKKNSSVVQKTSSGQTFSDILNLRCDLDLEHSNPIFQKDTPAYYAVQSNQVWLQTEQYFRRYRGKSLLETVIFWLHKPLLWPWLWR